MVSVALLKSTGSVCSERKSTLGSTSRRRGAVSFINTAIFLQYQFLCALFLCSASLELLFLVSVSIVSIVPRNSGIN